MNVITIETASLGDRSYIVHDGVHALVIDPQRDIDRIVGRPNKLASSSRTSPKPMFTMTT